MSTLKADTIQSTGGGAATLTKQHAAKAWCKFGNDAQPDDSFNISSGTDISTGRWRFAKTNSMGSANYTVAIASGQLSDSFNTGFDSACVESAANHAQSKYHEAGSAFQDFAASTGHGMHSVHGDLA